MGKLAKILDRQPIVKPCRLLSSGNEGGYDLLALNYKGCPIFIPESAHAFVANSIMRRLGSICLILRSCTWAQIVISVIKSVTVVMINFGRITSVKNLFVHQNTLPLPVNNKSSHGIESMFLTTPVRVPVELAEEFIMARAHNAIHTTSQRNDPVVRVGRLNHDMAFHTALHSNYFTALLRGEVFAGAFKVKGRSIWRKDGMHTRTWQAQHLFRTKATG